MSTLSTKKIIEEAESLPVEERAAIVDSLLHSMNPVDENIQDEWIRVAEQRLRNIKSGEAKTTPGDVVFANIRDKLQK